MGHDSVSRAWVEQGDVVARQREKYGLNGLINTSSVGRGVKQEQDVQSLLSWNSKEAAFVGRRALI